MERNHFMFSNEMESSDSYGSIETNSVDAKPPKSTANVVPRSRWAALLLLSCIGVVVISTYDKYGSKFYTALVYGKESNMVKDSKITTTETMTTTTEDDDDQISFTFIREGYSVLPYFQNNASSILKYSILDDYNAIMEPYVEMEFELLEDEDLTSSSTYRYSLCQSDDYMVCYKGEYSPKNAEQSVSVTIECSPYMTYDISVSEMDSENHVVRKGKGKAICMYVRREISSLSSSDLDDTMDAMYTLWSVSEEDGQALYGSNYHSSSYFSGAHDFNAAQQDADHIHEGLGFLTQHIKLTNLFELSVQAVNPSVTIPYWDFTKDVANNLTIFESSIFTARIFGEINKPADSYWGFLYSYDQMENAAIKNGRWAKIKAEKATKYPDMANGFGYMRGPWNMNPSPYVSRFSAYSPKLPSCNDYYGGLGMPGFMEFLETAPYGSHASTHGVIGSVYGCDKMDDLREQGIIKDEDSQLSICKKWGFYMKELYRANYISPAANCTVSTLDEKGIACGFTCNDDLYDSMVSELKSTISGQYLSSSITTTGWETWRDFICEGDAFRIFVGDHLESASPSDPSFWPIHPTQERLLQVKFMTGGGKYYSWPTSTSSNDYVCDKDECYEADYGVKKDFKSCCYGHYEYDQLLDWITGNTSNYIGYTNHEILVYTNPTLSNYSMPYIYDDFEWDHCDEDFDSLIEDLYDTYFDVAAPTAKPTSTPKPSSQYTHQPTPVSLSVDDKYPSLDSREYNDEYSPTPKPSKDSKSENGWNTGNSLSWAGMSGGGGASGIGESSDLGNPNMETEDFGNPKESEDLVNSLVVMFGEPEGSSLDSTDSSTASSDVSSSLEESASTASTTSSSSEEVSGGAPGRADGFEGVEDDGSSGIVDGGKGSAGVVTGIEDGGAGEEASAVATDSEADSVPTGIEDGGHGEDGAASSTDSEDTAKGLEDGGKGTTNNGSNGPPA